MYKRTTFRNCCWLPCCCRWHWGYWCRHSCCCWRPCNCPDVLLTTCNWRPDIASTLLCWCPRSCQRPWGCWCARCLLFLKRPCLLGSISARPCFFLQFLLLLVTRETREGWPLMTVETEANGDSWKYIWKRSFFGWFVGFFVPVQYCRFLSCLGCSSKPSTKYYFTHCTLFLFFSPRRPATWAGSHAESPVSVSLPVTSM